eukprot:1182605-Prorocentrum_minimum.AAC.2
MVIGFELFIFANSDLRSYAKAYHCLIKCKRFTSWSVCADAKMSKTFSLVCVFLTSCLLLCEGRKSQLEATDSKAKQLGKKARQDVAARRMLQPHRSCSGLCNP